MDRDLCRLDVRLLRVQVRVERLDLLDRPLRGLRPLRGEVAGLRRLSGFRILRRARVRQREHAHDRQQVTLHGIASEGWAFAGSTGSWPGSGGGGTKIAWNSSRAAPHTRQQSAKLNTGNGT